MYSYHLIYDKSTKNAIGERETYDIEAGAPT